MTERKKLVVLDCLAYAFRSFFAIRNLTNSAGQPLNAVFGFLMALQKARRDFKPDYAVVALDSKGPTFRDKMMVQYKAQREPTPEALKEQIPKLIDLIPAMGWNAVQAEGFEADDVIATLAEEGLRRKMEVVLLSTDKDILQLIQPGVRVFRESPKGGSLYGPEEVKARYGVGPEQIPDLLGLMGDNADNIPGVPGIGEKTAAELLRKYKDLEDVLKNASRIPKPKLSESLVNFANQARFSREMAVLVRKAPLVEKMEDLVLKEPDLAKLLPALKDFEFRKMYSEYSREGGGKPVEAAIKAPEPGAQGSKKKSKKAPGLPALKLENVDSMEALTARLRRPPFVSGKPAGFFAYPPGKPDRVFVCQAGSALQLAGKDLAGLAEMALGHFKEPVLFSGKALQVFLMKSGRMPPKGLLDLEIAGYLISAVRPWRDLGEAARALGMETPELETYGDEAQGELLVDEVKLARRAQGLWYLAPKARERLKEEGLEKLYDEVEGPLTTLLAKMEKDGIYLDVGVLKSLDKKAQTDLAELARKAVQAAGTDFNLNSPSQLSDVLFKKLNLPVQRKIKTGFSTDNEVLEALAPLHELPEIILEHRGLAKLSNTYLQALPKLVDPEDGRVHTSWNQAVAATGRLSSSEPNLQNIPIRTPLGRQIRKAFVPEKKGDLILAADYSQIELRVLAHYSKDGALIEAFKHGLDIHARTAARVMGISEDKVTDDMRRKAKVINFGILYGMSPFGLSRELGIPQGQAKEFIQAYFAQFPKVKAFLNSCVEQAREKGYVTTLLGRRRAIPEIASANRAVREFAQRTAANTPIQGSAADLIKKAMLDVDAYLERKKARSRILLQVHDELVLELAVEEKTWLPMEVKKIMEEAMSLSVPLKVGLGTGENWYEAKA